MRNLGPLTIPRGDDKLPDFVSAFHSAEGGCRERFAGRGAEDLCGRKETVQPGPIAAWPDEYANLPLVGHECPAYVLAKIDTTTTTGLF
jgi:hypothetical protein